ncbi:MAG: kinase inhibitor [Paenibacillus sp.]|nr:kinase inhibitor [Paenibacillus sp.]
MAKMIPLGDQAILVQLGERMDEATCRKVQQFADYVQRHPFNGMVEHVPAFTSVTVHYDSWQVYRSYLRQLGASAGSKPEAEDEASPHEIVAARLTRMLAEMSESEREKPAVVHIPVCYGGEFGPDLDEVARQNGLTGEEVVSIHTSGEYTVYMLGFAPGFPYLGGMSSRIAAPRRPTPRLAIPAGTVGIAGQQTGIYPIETPGGWQLIGRTPVPLFAPDRLPPTLLEAGHIVRFYPISRSEYDSWEGAGR